jgi:hypothetical protein
LIYPNITKTVEDYEKEYPKRDLPEGAIVTRYAPSPTGFIHIGALYASFVSQAFARQTNGVFYLRIEDTDTKRTIDNGIKKIDTINQYISFIISMISTHTNLQWGDDPIADYDLLSESKLLPQIIAEFRESYDECEAMLKMVVAKELEDNNVNVLIGKFLDSILNKLDTVTGGLSSAIKNIDLKSIIGDEDLTKFIGLLDKLK